MELKEILRDYPVPQDPKKIKYSIFWAYFFFGIIAVIALYAASISFVNSL